MVCFCFLCYYNQLVILLTDDVPDRSKATLACLHRSTRFSSDEALLMVLVALL